MPVLTPLFFDKWNVIGLSMSGTAYLSIWIKNTIDPILGTLTLIASLIVALLSAYRMYVKVVEEKRQSKFNNFKREQEYKKYETD